MPPRLLIAIVSTAALFAADVSAATIQIEADMVFDTHTSDVRFGTRTNTDIYQIDAPNVDLPLDTYDRIEIILTVGPNMRLVVPDQPGDVFTSAQAVWGGVGGYPSTTHELSIVGGSGELPINDPFTSIGVNIEGTGFGFSYQSDNGSTGSDAGFAFTSIVLSKSFTGRTLDGVYEPFGTLGVFFRYSTPEAVPDPGRFTFIEQLPIPEPSSLALLGVGAMLLARRR